jgi:hypothetical protein
MSLLSPEDMLVFYKTYVHDQALERQGHTYNYALPELCDDITTTIDLFATLLLWSTFPD